MSEPDPGDPAPFARLLQTEARELLRLLEETSLSEILVEEGETRIHIRRGVELEGVPIEVIAGLAEAPAPPALFSVTAPVVGRFSPAGDGAEPPRRGHPVVVGQQLGVIESMRVPHEVVSTVSGEVVEVLVQDGQPVEYGQPLFVVRPEE